MRGHARAHKAWAWFVVLLIGFIAGGYLGQLLGRIDFLEFLSYGVNFGMSSASPLAIDLGVIHLLFAIYFHVNVMSVVGLVLAAWFYKRC